MRPPLSSARSYWVITSAEKGAFFTFEGLVADDASSPGGLLATALARPVSRTRISLVTAHLSLILPSIRLTSLANHSLVSLCARLGGKCDREHTLVSVFGRRAKRARRSHARLVWAQRTYDCLLCAQFVSNATKERTRTFIFLNERHLSGQYGRSSAMPLLRICPALTLRQNVPLQNLQQRYAPCSAARGLRSRRW